MAQQIKKLNDSELKNLQNLEGKLGCFIVALESQPKLAHLSPAQLAELQAMEKTTDSVLLAYTC